MSAACPYCAAQADHCHGTLVRHADGTVECTDVTCLELGDERHGLVVVCEVQPDGCTCVVTRQAEVSHSE
jgi:hypothetical protein